MRPRTTRKAALPVPNRFGTAVKHGPHAKGTQASREREHATRVIGLKLSRAESEVRTPWICQEMALSLAHPDEGRVVLHVRSRSEATDHYALTER